MEKHIITSLDCEFELTIEEFDGDFTVCLTEFEIDSEKSKVNHTHYKTSSETEVYFGREELEKISTAINLFLSSDDNEI